MSETIDPGVDIGHVHLKVSDLDRAVDFYRDVLGFEEMARMGDQAAFLSAGGYHHHIGLNTWESKGGSPPPTRRRRTALAFPCVQPDVMVIPARREERGLVAHPRHLLESEHVAVEIDRAVEVGDLQMHMTDIYAWINGFAHVAIVPVPPLLPSRCTKERVGW